MLQRAATAIRSGAADAASADPTPTCAPPPMPAATYPGDPSNPGQGYGVPFLAEITGPPVTGPLGPFPMAGGKLLGGYDEQWGNETPAQNYGEVWRALTWNITGWASGLLELPSLQSVVSPNDIVFCQQSNDPSSPLYFALPNSSTTTCPPNNPLCGGKFPSGSFTTNNPVLAKVVARRGRPNPGILAPWEASIQAIAASLTVTGAAPDGALELAGTTEATTTIIDHQGTNQTCNQAEPMTINLSTQEGTSPVGGPPGLGYQIPPAPLSGPLGQAAATVSTDNMQIPRFEFVPPQCFLAAAFNVQLAGFNAQGFPNWPCTPTNYNCQEFASNPGWSQFGADVKVAKIDPALPTGPPPGFSL